MAGRSIGLHFMMEWKEGDETMKNLKNVLAVTFFAAFPMIMLLAAQNIPAKATTSLTTQVTLSQQQEWQGLQADVNKILMKTTNLSKFQMRGVSSL